MASTLSQKWLTISIEQLFNAQEMSSKMASTLLSSNIANQYFCQKALTFANFVAYDFVQISPYAACGPNTKQIMYGETLDMSDIKCHRQ